MIGRQKIKISKFWLTKNQNLEILIDKKIKIWKTWWRKIKIGNIDWRKIKIGNIDWRKIKIGNIDWRKIKIRNIDWRRNGNSEILIDEK
jgi:hypothetical protein